MKFLPTPTAPSNWLVGQREARLVHCPSASWDQRPLSSCPGSSASTVGASLGFGSHCARWRQRLRIDEFRAGRLDVGFTRPLPAADGARLRSECVYRDSLIAVLPKGHRASARAMVPVKQLVDEPFVLFHRAGAPELFDTIVGLCSRAGFTPRVVNEADMMQTVLTLVEADEGVALVPACVSNLRGSGVVLRPVQPDTVRIPLVMVWPAGHESPARESFLCLVREHAETIRGMLPGLRRG